MGALLFIIENSYKSKLHALQTRIYIRDCCDTVLGITN